MYYICYLLLLLITVFFWETEVCQKPEVITVLFILLYVICYQSIKMVLLCCIFELPHNKTNKMTCAPSEDSDQLGHPSNLLSLLCPHEKALGPWLSS